jgi:hypothetical protein
MYAIVLHAGPVQYYAYAHLTVSAMVAGYCCNRNDYRDGHKVGGKGYLLITNDKWHGVCASFESSHFLVYCSRPTAVTQNNLQEQSEKGDGEERAAALGRFFCELLRILLLTLFIFIVFIDQGDGRGAHGHSFEDARGAAGMGTP